MIPAAMIERAAADGVRIEIRPAGKVRLTGPDGAVKRWAPLVQARKQALSDALTAAAHRAGTDPAIVPDVLTWLADWLERDLDEICATPALADAVLDIAPDSIQFRRWRRAASNLPAYQEEK